MPEREIPEGSVVITPAEMFSELRAVHDAVNHLSAVVDPALQELRSDVADNKAEIKAHDLRFRGLEARVWFTAGAAAVLGSLGGYIASALVGG